MGGGERMGVVMVRACLVRGENEHMYHSKGRKSHSSMLSTASKPKALLKYGYDLRVVKVRF